MSFGLDEALSQLRKWMAAEVVVACAGSFRSAAFSLRGEVMAVDGTVVRIGGRDFKSEAVVDLAPAESFPSDERIASPFLREDERRIGILVQLPNDDVVLFSVAAP